MRSISLRSWLLALSSALLQWLPFPIAGPVPLWRRAVCWFCLAPLLSAVLGKDRNGRQLNVRQCFWIGYLCGVIWFLGNCYWIYQTMYLYGGMPKAAALGVLVLFSLYLGLYQGVFAALLGWMHKHASCKLVLLAAPFLWVALELARARITGFPWDLLGYTQLENQVLTMLAPVAGVMAVSFVVAAMSAFFAGAFVFGDKRKQAMTLAAGLGVVALLSAGLLYVPRDDESYSVATLLQENLSVGTQAHAAESISPSQKYQQFVALSKFPEPFEIYWLRPSLFPDAIIHKGRAKQSPDFVIWPEAPADFATSDAVFRAQLSNLARSEQTTIVSGAVGVDLDPRAEAGYHEFGSAAVFAPDGSYMGRYDKIHRVPWGEYVPYKQFFFFAGKLVSGVGNMEAGTEHKLFTENGHKFGVFICYESIFGDEVRQFVKDGANVLINISDDGWYGDTGAPWQHLDMERMRAIENRRWILRDTNTGITTSVDPYGRGDFLTTRHVRAAFQFPFAYRSGTTFYTRHGDWFAWLCALISVALLATAFQRRKKVH